jgi:hypothetical protein
MLHVQETGVRGSEKYLLAEHTALMAILKLDRYIIKFRCKNQHASSFMKMQKTHQAVDHPQCCLRKV